MYDGICINFVIMATLAKYNSSHFFVILKTKKMILSTNEIKVKMQNARKRSNPLPANISSIIKREIGLPEPEKIVNRTNNKTYGRIIDGIASNIFLFFIEIHFPKYTFHCARFIVSLKIISFNG